MRLRSCLLAALITIPTLFVAAGDDPISADRPGFGDSTRTLEAGLFQFEMGYSYVRFDNFRLVSSYDPDTGDFTPLEDNGVQQQNFGEVRLRYGLSDKIELRIDLGSFTVESLPDDSGFTSPGLSIKHQFYEQGDTAMSAVFGVLTTAGVNFNEDDANFYVSYIAETVASGMPWSFYADYNEGSDELLLSLYTGGDLTGNWDWSAGVAGSAAFGESSRVLITTISGESVVTEIPLDVDDENAYYLDLNFVYPLDEKSAFDLFVGTGLDDNSPDYFFGMGYAHRF